MLRSIIKFVKRMINSLTARTENTFSMQARDLGIIGKDFDDLYEKLVRAEDDLRDIANKYTIGDPDIKMTDVDESFSHMKRTMKDVRTLAIEARNAKRE